MGYIINQVSNVLVKFIGKFAGFESGEFNLSTGKTQFIIETTINPDKVWISTDENITDGCGNIPVNKIGCSYINKKLIFDADIQTDTCKVYWFATE